MGAVKIDREFFLSKPDCFADIRVAPGPGAPFFIEVKFGYENEKLLSRLTCKFGSVPEQSSEKVIVLVLDTHDRRGWPQLERDIRQAINPAFKLKVWNEEILLSLLKDQFGISVRNLDPDSLLELRDAIDRAKGSYAFGNDPTGSYIHYPLHAQLIWHLGFWRVKNVRKSHNCKPRDILPPGLYRKAIVVVADMCGFSGYVRATEDEHIIRDNLTAFYSRARYEITNSGGLLLQFVGDEVIAVFGIPDRSPADGPGSSPDSRTSSANWTVHVGRVATANQFDPASERTSPGDQYWRSANGFASSIQSDSNGCRGRQHQHCRPLDEHGRAERNCD